MRAAPARRRISPGLPGVAVMGIVCCLGACSLPPGDAPSTPRAIRSSPGASGAANVTSLVRELDARQKYNTASSNVRIVAGARPTVLSDGNSLRTMVIRDEDSSTWQAGRYRLEVSCSGAGILVAYLGVDSSSQIKELMPCRPGISTDHVDLDVPRVGHEGVIVITPVGDTKAAVAYRVIKL